MSVQPWCVSQRPIGVQRLPVFALVTPLLLVASCSDHGADHGQAAAPWVAGCFMKTGSESTADRAYVGMTKEQALAAAKKKGQQLVLVGAGGKCVRLDDLVGRAHPVAVAFDTGSPVSGVPSSAKIVFATSDRMAKYAGWGLR